MLGTSYHDWISAKQIKWGLNFVFDRCFARAIPSIFTTVQPILGEINSSIPIWHGKLFQINFATRFISRHWLTSWNRASGVWANYLWHCPKGERYEDQTKNISKPQWRSWNTSNLVLKNNSAQNICAKHAVYRATKVLHWAKQTQTTTAAVATAGRPFWRLGGKII